VITIKFEKDPPPAVELLVEYYPSHWQSNHEPVNPKAGHTVKWVPDTVSTLDHFTRKWYDGKTPEDVAQAISASEASVRVHVYRYGKVSKSYRFGQELISNDQSS
jgi:hypothetical protein